MGSFARSRLTPLQSDLLDAFFAREQRLFLTGGGALAGFYLGHRDTEDLDLFSPPGPDLDEATQALSEAVTACSATLTVRTRYQDFRRFMVVRGDETCLVDLVIDRAPVVDSDKPLFGAIRVDSLREIAANKICTLIGRSEIKDLVDLQALLAAGIDLEQAFVDAEKKEGGADPATLAWILDELKIAPTARLPGDVDPVAIDRFRIDLIHRLRALAFARARR